MEDAAICSLDLGDGNSLFAVFDGHGGTLCIIQGLKLASMLKGFSSTNSSPLTFIKRKSIKKPLMRLLGESMKEYQAMKEPISFEL